MGARRKRDSDRVVRESEKERRAQMRRALCGPQLRRGGLVEFALGEHTELLLMRGDDDDDNGRGLEWDTIGERDEWKRGRTHTDVKK